MIATMSTVWDRTAEFLSDNLVALTPIVLFGIFVPLSVFGSLFPLQATTGPVGGVVIAAILLVLSLVQVWGGIAITALAFDPAAGRGPAVATASRRLLPVIAISLLALLIVFVATLPIGVALGFGGLDPATLNGDTVSLAGVDGGAIAFSFFYALVLFLVFIWAYLRFFTLIVPIMVMERRGPGVFKRNLVLTRGIAWKLFGMLVLYVVVLQVSVLAAQGVVGSVLRLLLGGEGVVTVAGVLTHIVVAAISTIFSVMAVAFTAKVYLATRDAREAIVEAA